MCKSNVPNVLRQFNHIDVNFECLPVHEHLTYLWHSCSVFCPCLSLSWYIPAFESIAAFQLNRNVQFYLLHFHHRNIVSSSSCCGTACKAAIFITVHKIYANHTFTVQPPLFFPALKRSKATLHAYLQTPTTCICQSQHFKQISWSLCTLNDTFMHILLFPCQKCQSNANTYTFLYMLG